MPDQSNDRLDRIPVFEESLNIQKTTYETDRVLIKTSVQERTEYTDVNLRSDDALIERIPINRVVEKVTEPREEGSTLIIPIFEEILVTEKRLLLKEEIHIHRREVMKHVREPIRLRSEIVSVERPALDETNNQLTKPSNREDLI